MRMKWLQKNNRREETGGSQVEDDRHRQFQPSDTTLGTESAVMLQRWGKEGQGREFCPDPRLGGDSGIEPAGATQ
jgi:hypothetical protein